MYVTARISDGLGNRFFQVAAMLWYAKKHGHTPVFVKKWIEDNKSHPGPKTIQDFFPDISIIESVEGTWTTIEPPADKIFTFLEFPKIEGNIKLHGCFQAWQYVDLPLPTLIQTQVVQIPRSFFLHVRRGDYLICTHHYVHLDEYIRRACSLFPGDAVAIICSDDIDWCKATLPLLTGRNNMIFYDGDDFTTLRTMVHCDLGGICANSTYSWWAAYFGSRMDPVRTYTLPRIWGQPGRIPPAGDLLAPWTIVL